MQQSSVAYLVNLVIYLVAKWTTEAKNKYWEYEAKGKLTISRATIRVENAAQDWWPSIPRRCFSSAALSPL